MRKKIIILFQNFIIYTIYYISYFSSLVFLIAHNGFQLTEGGDFKALNWQPIRNFDKSKKLDLTNELPLLGR